MIHLEGLGILGCYIALRLEQEGIDFTWYDDGRATDGVAAWPACTGAIFPTGHADDLAALDVWRGHLRDRAFAPFMEEADYIFSTKKPPHGGRYGFTELARGVRLGEVTSLHLAGPEWVRATRARFIERAAISPPPGSRVVIAHGFNQRLVRYMWGWTVPVKLRTQVYDPCHRPCLYFRRGRFAMAYAYPIPGTDLWYAGSSLISQREPKPLDVEKHFKRWRGQFMDLGGGFVTGVARAGRPRQGWRPVGAAGDDAWVREIDGRLCVRPLWHSGVRWAPLVWEALREELGQ